MTQVQFATATGSGSGLVLTFPEPVTKGNIIILAVAAHGAGAITGEIHSESLGNVYNKDFETSASAVPDTRLIQMYSSQVATGGACTLTCVIGGGGASAIEMYAIEWSGMFDGTNAPGQAGAAWVDYEASEGSGQFPPFTMHFRTDQSAGTYYGDKLALLAVAAYFSNTLTVVPTIFPASQDSITVTWPPSSFGNVAVGLMGLYVGSSAVGTVDCSINIIAPVPLQATCGSCSGGVAGSGFGCSMLASGGTGPYSFTIVGGALPPGLTLNTSTGAITGNPTTIGAYTFQVHVADSAGASVTITCGIVISSSAGCADPTSGRGLEVVRPSVEAPTVPNAWWRQTT